MSAKLTQKQQIVLEFVQRYLSEQRLAPLIREIQHGCQIASYKSTVDRLNALERKGLIKRAPNQHRGIRLVRRRADLLVPVAAGTSSVSSDIPSGAEAS